MTLDNYVLAGFSGMVVIGVLLKMIGPHREEIRTDEAVILLVLFGSFCYLQLRGSNQVILFVLGAIVLARMYKRNAPSFMARVNRRILENRERNRNA